MVYYGGENSANPVEDKMINKLNKQNLFPDRLIFCKGNDKREIKLPRFGIVTIRVANGNVKLYEVTETNKVFE